MSRMRLWAVIIVMAGAGFFCPLAGAEEVSSQALINHSLEYDGKPVSYTGELIGAVLKRSGHVWLNIMDGENAIGVWAPCSLAKPIKFAGSYAARGDVIRVEGVFHRSCVEHGGALDIHALELTIIAPGAVVAHPIERYKIIVFLVLLGVLICLLIVRLLLRNFRKN